MKKITITVNEATANALIKLARHGYIKARTQIEVSAFNLACYARPGEDKTREIWVGGEKYTIEPNFRLT